MNKKIFALALLTATCSSAKATNVGYFSATKEIVTSLTLVQAGKATVGTVAVAVLTYYIYSVLAYLYDKYSTKTVTDRAIERVAFWITEERSYANYIGHFVVVIIASYISFNALQSGYSTMGMINKRAKEEVANENI